MLKNFKTYQLAIQFHRDCQKLKMPGYLLDQLLRASTSIVLDIAESSGKLTPADKRRFYAIALGSLRESMAALELKGDIPIGTAQIGDQLGACIYRLCHPNQNLQRK